MPARASSITSLSFASSDRAFLQLEALSAQSTMASRGVEVDVRDALELGVLATSNRSKGKDSIEEMPSFSAPAAMVKRRLERTGSGRGARGSAGARRLPTPGATEAYFVNHWRPLWNSLDADQRARYLDHL